MENSLKQISCDPECGFLIRSHEEDEVVTMAQKHVKNAHHKNTTEKELKNMIESI